MTTNAARARNVLGELDCRFSLYQYAEDRAFFWHELFFVQSIEEYMLFLWLEADAEELQGDAAYRERDGQHEKWLRDEPQKYALVHYARAALFRGAILTLLRLDYRPFLPAWIDALEDRWHGPPVQQEGEVIYPDMDDEALGIFANKVENTLSPRIEMSHQLMCASDALSAILYSSFVSFFSQVGYSSFLY